MQGACEACRLPCTDDPDFCPGCVADMALKRDIIAAGPLMNFSTPDGILFYLPSMPQAAAEYLGQEAAIHESCMNQRNADMFYALADRVIAATCIQCGVMWPEHPDGDGVTQCPGDFPNPDRGA